MKRNMAKETKTKSKWTIGASFWNKLVFGLMGVFMFFLIGFVENQHANRTVKSTQVRINYEADNYFVDEADILRTLTMNNADQIVGKKYRDIELKNLELRLESIKFVEDAQISTDHKGTLMVEIIQSKPIARIVNQNAPHAYIGSNATALSTSDKFTSRVLIIDGPFAPKLMKENYLLTDSTGRLEQTTHHVADDLAASIVRADEAPKDIPGSGADAALRSAGETAAETAAHENAIDN